MWKSAIAGALVAVLIVATIAAGAFYYVTHARRVTPLSGSDEVVLVFASSAPDGASVAGLVSIVAQGRLRDVSPDTTVTVPGTSFSRLSDAYVFGGGAGVSRALGRQQSGSLRPYVVIPSEVWRHMVDASGGLLVTVPTEVTEFDGSRLSTIRAGEQTLTAEAVGSVLRSLSYVPPDEQSTLRGALEQRLAALLVRESSAPNALQSNLSPSVLDAWRTQVLPGVVGR